MSSEPDGLVATVLPEKTTSNSKNPPLVASTASSNGPQTRAKDKAIVPVEKLTNSLDSPTSPVKTVASIVQPPQRLCHPFKLGEHAGNIDALLTHRPKTKGCASMLISPRDTNGSTLYNSVLMYRLHGEDGVSQGMVFPTTTQERVLVSYSSMVEFMVLRHFASQQSVLMDSEVTTMGDLPLAGGRMKYGKLNYAIPPYSDIIGEPEKGSVVRASFNATCGVSHQSSHVAMQLLCYDDHTCHPQSSSVTVTSPPVGTDAQPAPPHTIIMESKPIKEFTQWSAQRLQPPALPKLVTHVECYNPPAAVQFR